jgi:hypothetical protein
MRVARIEEQGEEDTQGSLLKPGKVLLTPD